MLPIGLPPRLLLLAAAAQFRAHRLPQRLDRDEVVVGPPEIVGPVRGGDDVGGAVDARVGGGGLRGRLAVPLGDGGLPLLRRVAGGPTIILRARSRCKAARAVAGGGPPCCFLAAAAALRAAVVVSAGV